MRRFEVTAIVSVNVVVKAPNKETAQILALDHMPKEVKVGYASVGKYHYCVDDVPNVSAIEIMDGTNGHDSNLVEKINKCYQVRRDSFRAIVKFLADRDEDDFETCDPKTADIETLCFEYCQHVADDTDLETIISYCRLID